MLPITDKFAIEPQAHVAISPLASNQVPVIILKHGLALHKIMLVVMVFLEEEFSLLVKEMDSSTIIAKKRSCILVKEVCIRAEPEFDCSNTHRINQIHAKRSNLTVTQLESLSANALDLFTFVKKGFQFVEIAGVIIHFKGRGFATDIRTSRSSNNRSTFLL